MQLHIGTSYQIGRGIDQARVDDKTTESCRVELDIVTMLQPGYYRPCHRGPGALPGRIKIFPSLGLKPFYERVAFPAQRGGFIAGKYLLEQNVPVFLDKMQPVRW